MSPTKWQALWARSAVSAGALLPYLPLLGFRHVYLTDDQFTSDIFNGELPFRVLLGRVLASGRAPTWTSELCSGFPLAAGSSFEPISLGAFTSLAPAAALSVLVLSLVLIAAHGTYGLARRCGATRSAAVLAGIAFGGSGYFVTQLKHLAILSTVAWMPLALLLLDRALTPAWEAQREGVAASPAPPLWRRLTDLALFGLVVAEQSVAGFPQSLYICGLAYATWSGWLLLRWWRSGRERGASVLLAGALVVAVSLGALAGAVTLLPLAELGALSDRQGPLSWEFASMLPFAWRDLLSFVVPYANGDVSNATYVGEGLFWENYGYVGLATFVLALWGVVRGWRRPRVVLIAVITLVALALVLGRHTPVFRLAWQYFPGMNRFRFPTRFLVVVDLGLALLASVGFTVLMQELRRWLAAHAPRAPQWLSLALILGTALDLFANQTRQNPFVAAEQWLSPPQALPALGEQTQRARLYSPLHNYFHRIAFRAARGWEDVEPYAVLRETVAPNTGAYWGVATADCYAGIAPSWWVDVWGDHNRNGYLIPLLQHPAQGHVALAPSFARIARLFGVTHLLSPIEIRSEELLREPSVTSTYLYALGGERARILPRAEWVRGSEAAARRLLEPGFNPFATVLIEDEPTARASLPELLPAVDDVSESRVDVVEDRGSSLQLAVSAPHGGYLLLADTYYPGWSVTVDGVPSSVLRANIAARVVRLPPGARSVQFHYAGQRFYLGLRLASGAVLTLLLAAGAFAWLSRRARRRSTAKVAPPASA